jgi:hypothetical protein
MGSHPFWQHEIRNKEAKGVPFANANFLLARCLFQNPAKKAAPSGRRSRASVSDKAVRQREEKAGERSVLVARAVRVHPVPSRTRSLSSRALRVLRWKRRGSVSRCQPPFLLLFFPLPSFLVSLPPHPPPSAFLFPLPASSSYIHLFFVHLRVEFNRFSTQE